MNNYYALIMAGGGGTRLWPLSRRERPKQMLPLVDKDSMFRVSVMRLQPLFTLERIFVVTGANQVEAMRADVPELPAENFILEPFGQDSAPAAALGIAHIACLDPNATIAILTADHYIRDLDGFRQSLAAAYQVAEENYTVTLGIKPTFPSTGFGYIQQGKSYGTVEGLSVYHSDGFREKPDEKTAQHFLDSGLYSWNSGMFIWKASQALAEFKRQQPVIYQNLQTIQAAFGSETYRDTISRIWSEMPKISLDFAVMEHAEKMAMIPVSIGWSDIGSWAAVYDELATQEQQNVAMGDSQHISLNTQGTLVYSNRTVVTIGLEDVVIIDTGDVLMVCRKDCAQDVKQAVDYLKKNALDNLL